MISSALLFVSKVSKLFSIFNSLEIMASSGEAFVFLYLGYVDLKYRVTYLSLSFFMNLSASQVPDLVVSPRKII